MIFVIVIIYYNYYDFLLCVCWWLAPTHSGRKLACSWPLITRGITLRSLTQSPAPGAAATLPGGSYRKTGRAEPSTGSVRRSFTA
jgi:hypothetical protein